MSNELEDIAKRLFNCGIDGWQIITAEKRQDGGWSLVVLPVAKEEPKDQEATNDHN